MRPRTDNLTFTVLAQQLSWAVEPFLRSPWGGGPLSFWQAGGGDLQYIIKSLIHTHWAPGLTSA
jgi:hypothetical protein